MKSFFTIIASTSILLCMALLIQIGQAATLANTPATTETWRLGVTSEGNAAQSTLIGRAASVIASFRSNRDVQNIYFLLPASGREQKIQSATYRIIQRTGSYTSTAQLTLEVYDAAGTLLRTASAAPIDLQTATTGSWVDLPLSTTPAQLTIAPNEYLIARFSLGGGSAGDLDIRPEFEIVVMHGTVTAPTPTETPNPTPNPTPPKIYLPLILRQT
jgi:hypothetical protein